jgi:hypothetical protein
MPIKLMSDKEIVIVHSYVSFLTQINKFPQSLALSTYLQFESSAYSILINGGRI